MLALNILLGNSKAATRLKTINYVFLFFLVVFVLNCVTAHWASKLINKPAIKVQARCIEKMSSFLLVTRD